jgi:hypothetical protein
MDIISFFLEDFPFTEEIEIKDLWVGLNGKKNEFCSSDCFWYTYG